MNPAFVSVVIPAYNEGHCILSNLERVVGHLSSRFLHFELIVVDDGSTDDTREKVFRAAQEDPRIVPVSFPINHGKGFVIREGILRARGDAIFFTDADLSTPVEEVEKALAELSEGFSVVIGSRQHPDSIISVHQAWLRERVGIFFNLLVRMFFPLPFKDTQCGFKSFRKEAAQEIFRLARTDGFAFDVEVLLIAQKLGYAVKEIPVSWADSPASKVRVAQDLWSVVKELLTIYWNDRRGLYNHKPGRSSGGSRWT